MAGSVNRVILIGNVGREPEIRTTASSGRIANLTLATSEDWTDKASGERKSKVEWHRVSIFNDSIVSVVERFVKKGSKLYLEGSLQTRKWTDNAGVEKYTTEINIGKFGGQLTLLDSKPRDGDAAPAGGRQEVAGGDIDADHIPF